MEITPKKYAQKLLFDLIYSANIPANFPYRPYYKKKTEEQLIRLKTRLERFIIPRQLKLLNKKENKNANEAKKSANPKKSSRKTTC